VRRYSYFFRETATALRRNALVTFAAISTVFISLFLLGGALLVERQVRLMTGEWASKVEVSVFLREDASSEEIEALGRKIESIPEVDEVFFENREQAYANFQQLFRDNPALVENVDPSAMPQSYRVKLVDPADFPVVGSQSVLAVEAGGPNSIDVSGASRSTIVHSWITGSGSRPSSAMFG
jgi:cell division transport system permease protein